MSAKQAWSLLKETTNEFFEDKALRLSAALAYYSIFSIAPLLIIVIGIGGFFLGQEVVRQQLQDQLTQLIGEQATATVVSMSRSHPQGTHLLATVIGILVLLFGASGVFGQLQDSLNVIWEVQPKPGRGLWLLIRSRFLSFTMVLGIGFLLLVSMIISTALAALTGALCNLLPIPGLAAHSVNFIVSFLVITLLFAMIFKILPDAKVRWRDVWFGAVFTSLLFSIGKHLLGLYLGQASTASSYGAAGSLVLVLLWVYYSSVILFVGAEFTQTYAKATGSRIVPTPNAVPVTAEARAEQGMPRKEQLRAPAGAGGDANTPSLDPARLGTPAVASARIQSPREKLEQALAEQSWKSIPRTREIIRRNPWPYLGLALGFGLATGSIVKRDFAHRAHVS